MYELRKSLSQVLPLMLILPMLSQCIGTDVVNELIGPDLRRVEIEPTTLSLMKDQEVQVPVTYFDYSGNPSTTQFEWISRDGNIASVDNGGLVRGNSRGQTYVVATAETKKDSILVNVFVDPEDVAFVEVTSSTNMVAVGDSVQLMASAKNSQGEDITGVMEMWALSNTGIATISSTGFIKGLSPGITNVMVKVDDVSSAPFQIRVGNGNRMGNFVGQNGYSASGTVTIIESITDYLVRLEDNFTTQNGPGLHIYLARSSTSAASGVDLGELKKSTGGQSYDIPPETDSDKYSHVLIYCKPFGVVFASAELN